MNTPTDPQHIQLQDDLYTATIEGDVSRMEQLLAAGANPDYVSTPDDGATKLLPGKSYLHMAAATMHDESIRVLVNWGADVNLRDDEGVTPLHRLCRTGTVMGMRTLLDAGADMHIADNDGKTPRKTLDDMARSNSNDALSCLEVLDEYMKLPRINTHNEPDKLKERLYKKHQGVTPLDNPQVWREFDAIGKVLLEQGTPLTKDDLWVTNDHGESVIERAVRFRSLDKVLDHLIAQGDRLSVDEMLHEPSLLSAIHEHGAASQLFTTRYLAEDGVSGLLDLQKELGEPSVGMIANPHCLRLDVQNAHQRLMGGHGR